MNLLAKRRKSLPTIPQPADEHPDLRSHREKSEDLERRRASTRAGLVALEEERGRVSGSLAEERVTALLAEGDGDSGQRVASSTQRLAEIDKQLVELRERAATEAEAIRRLAEREPAIRRRVTDDLRADVHRVQRELMTQLAKQFEGLAPITQQLLELRRRHGGLVLPCVWLDELNPAARGANTNRLQAWIRGARAIGVDVDL